LRHCVGRPDRGSFFPPARIHEWTVFSSPFFSSCHGRSFTLFFALVLFMWLAAPREKSPFLGLGFFPSIFSIGPFPFPFPPFMQITPLSPSTPGVFFQSGGLEEALPFSEEVFPLPMFLSGPTSLYPLFLSGGDFFPVDSTPYNMGTPPLPSPF